MGWWWSSPSEQTSTASSPALSNPQSTTTTTTTTTTLSQDPASSPTTPPTTREDAELREFLAAIEWTSDTKPNPATTPSTSSPSDPTSTTTDPDPSSISFDSLYPTTMSCRSAFDYAFFCQSFGGQWVNVYRYGELRSCSEHWENFWLCMKARGYSDESRRNTIREHYRQKAIKKYKMGGQASSEDVWEVRTEPVENPFGRDIKDYYNQQQQQQQQKEKIEGEPLGQV